MSQIVSDAQYMNPSVAYISQGFQMQQPPIQQLPNAQFQQPSVPRKKNLLNFKDPISGASVIEGAEPQVKGKVSNVKFIVLS